MSTPSPAEYRRLSAVCRRQAALADDPRIRATLLELSADYARKADQQVN